MKYFQIEEFDCRETGENKMDPEFLEMLDDLRARCGFAFIITSGYRSPNHSIERQKVKPGTHAQGIAADIKIFNDAQRYIILKEAIEAGFGGIGVAKSYIHVDSRVSKRVWTY